MPGRRSCWFRREATRPSGRAAKTVGVTTLQFRGEASSRFRITHRVPRRLAALATQDAPILPPVPLPHTPSLRRSIRGGDGAACRGSRLPCRTASSSAGAALRRIAGRPDKLIDLGCDTPEYSWRKRGICCRGTAVLRLVQRLVQAGRRRAARRFHRGDSMGAGLSRNGRATAPECGRKHHRRQRKNLCSPSRYPGMDIGSGSSRRQHHRGALRR